MKPRFVPTFPIPCTCLGCGRKDAELFPGGVFCPTCSEPMVRAFVHDFARTNGGYHLLSAETKALYYPGEPISGYTEKELRTLRKEGGLPA